MRTAIGLMLAVVFTAGAEALQQPRLRPSPSSPIAADGTFVYGVGTDGETILATRRSGDGANWEVVVRIPGARLRGMAWLRGRLYATDGARASLYAIATEGKSTEQPVLVHQGSPLQQPGEMAVAGSLVIADSGARRLFRVDISPSGATVSPLGRFAIAESMFIAGWPGEVIVSDPETGRIEQISDLGAESEAPVKLWTMQRRIEPSGSPVQRSEDPLERQRSVRRVDYPGVDRPAATAVYNGVVYVIDAESRRVFAASVHDARAVRIEAPALSNLDPTRLIVSQVEMLVFEGRTGRLLRMPRVVPTEMRYVAAANTAALAEVRDYLVRRKLLPDVTSSAGADFYAERAITVTRVTLDGTRTLGDIVDEQVPSSEFASYRTEGHLRETNNYDAAEPVRDQRVGTFRVPRVEVRYLTVFEASEIQGTGTEFHELSDRLRAALRFSPLQRVLTTAAAAPAAAQMHPNDPNCLAASAAFDQVLATISYTTALATLKSMSVGVAERQFDRSHPDFDDAVNPVFKVLEGDQDEGSAAAPPASAAPDNGEPVKWRNFEDTDHGTAVASLIAARRRPFATKTLLPGVQIVPLHHEDPGMSQDIERSITDSHTSVFNLSLTAEVVGEPEALLTQVETYQNLATFVVAAGNNGREVCRPNFKRYPVCWGEEHNNVIVVGGTAIDGKTIHPRSNTGRYVHVVAPASGFFAAGGHNSYVPVEGTSFATALVTTTAAALTALGVDKPALVKQRIIATADFDPILPEWARRLNVERAISNLDYAVTRQGSTNRRVLSLERRGQDIAFILDRNGQKLALILGQIRRLMRDSRDPSRFVLLYADPEEKIKMERVKAPQGAWTFFYRALDASNMPTGAQVQGDLAEFDDYVGPIK
jgi:hypothetical protein